MCGSITAFLKSTLRIKERIPRISPSAWSVEVSPFELTRRAKSPTGKDCSFSIRFVKDRDGRCWRTRRMKQKILGRKPRRTIQIIKPRRRTDDKRHARVIEGGTSSAPAEGRRRKDRRPTPGRTPGLWDSFHSSPPASGSAMTGWECPWESVRPADP